ncbi:MAG: chalcone isomerase [Alteromonadaceae bacterium]|uniref:chalcone isomerase family protein n=1 Tax=Marinobacter sp. V034 TaxID=3459610 RepID=UPI000C3EA257|nr:chalcone isomerase [Alteromonadaceae bacterium]MBH86010.1 chalcone isomerase [Alteromonadaceae bacterium]
MKKLTSAFLLSMTLAAPVSAVTIEGVDMPDQMKADGSELVLNGAGVRSKWFIDLYVGGLYVSHVGSDPKAIVAADEPQAIRLHIISGMITSDKMTSATLEGFDASTDGNTAPIQAEIDEFMGVFKDEIKEGDVFDLVYLPGEGVKVSKNGNARDTISGIEFKKALFGIWLSDEPAQEDLKAAMLGKD